MNYAQLKFPPYEWIKALPKTQIHHYRDRVSGKYIPERVPREYSFTLFSTPTSVYGRFSYNEDGDGFLCFDVMEDGYCDHNRLGKSLKFNKANYQILCKHAQEVYEQFQRELFKDMSYLWVGKDPKDYAEE